MMSVESWCFIFGNLFFVRISILNIQPLQGCGFLRISPRIASGGFEVEPLQGSVGAISLYTKDILSIKARSERLV